MGCVHCRSRPYCVSGDPGKSNNAVTFPPWTKKKECLDGGIVKPVTLVHPKLYGGSLSMNMKTLIFAAIGISTLWIGALNAAPTIPFLPTPQNISTVPPNGDVNPYGVAFVPHDFPNNTGGPLQPGDILVSNFNNSNNLQGTGTTIVRIGADGSFSVFFTTPNATLGGPGTGLSTALAVLKKGFVLVGSMPSSDGTAATASPGSLLVLDAKGHLLSMITDPTINGPWDMTVDDHGDNVAAFVSNAFNGTVVRLDLHFASNGVTVSKKTVIASGYHHQSDPVTFVDGPTGLVYDANHDMLFVASTLDNAVYAVQGAEKATTSQGTGSTVYADATHLHGPLGLALAPNGHFLVTNNDAINGDPNQPSEIVEFTPGGHFVTQLSVDPSQGGSFGLAVNTKDNIATFAAVDDNTASLLIWTLAVPH
jgi:hypothetical protein